ncbi:MAG: hypothetical protein M1819_004306 [Sarea resinae]|nr:MAG: hypothetical protein M1819_004306 [Sarea resinae]
MRHHGNLETHVEANEAAWEATKGAAIGAAKLGTLSAIAGVIAYATSPVYRGLTKQFKLFLQMGGMTLGGMVEADSRLRKYETSVLQRERLARARARYAMDDEERAWVMAATGGGGGQRQTQNAK